MKNTKKLITISLLAILAVAVLGSSVLAIEGSESLPKYKIGMAYYSFTDYLGSRVKKLFDYYGKEFNVEMLFAEGMSSEQQLNNVDNFIQQGVDGIIAISPTEGMVAAAQKAGIPIMAFGNLQSREDPKTYSKYDMFAGVITEDDALAVREMLQEVYDAGCRNVAYVTPYAVDESNIRAYTIEQEINSGNFPGMKIVTSFVGSDIVEAVQNMAISYPEIDVILATNGVAGTMETIFNVVYSMGLDWKMASLDIPDGAADFLASGQYIWSCGGQFSTAAPAFALMYNEITGNRIIENTEEIMWRRFVNITTPEEYRQYEKYIDGDIPAYTAEEVKEWLKVFNEDVSLEMFEEINAAYTIENVVERHKDLLN